MKYNVSGLLTTSLFFEGIEAQSKDEAIDIFKTTMEKRIGENIDWTEWQNLEVKKQNDYSDLVNECLKSNGYNVTVIGSTTHFTHNVFNLYFAYLSNNSYLIFMVIENKVYIPFFQLSLRLRLFTQMEMNYDSLTKLVYSSYWVNNDGKRLVFSKKDNSKYLVYTKGKGYTYFGIRFTNLLKRLVVDSLIVEEISLSGQIFTLLDSDSISSPELKYIAKYQFFEDEEPYSLEKIEKII